MLKLVIPSIKHKQDATKYIQEFYDYNSSINNAKNLDMYLKDNYELFNQTKEVKK